MHVGERGGLTVVVPLYNKRETVCRAVHSVLGQLEGGDRLIVVDDGSTDGSADVLADINDGRLCVITQKNKGVSAARNRGIDEAQTEHVAFLDADDWWLAGVVSQFKQMICSSPECVLYCIGHVRSRAGARPEGYVDSPVEDGESLEGAEFISAYSREQLVNSSASCVKKAQVQQIGGFPEGATSGEDIYVWLRLALLGRVGVSRVPRVVIERPEPGGREPDDRDVVPYHVRWFSDPVNFKRLSRAVRRAVARFFFYRGINMCAGQVMAKRRRDALRQVRAIGRIDPAILFPGGLIVIMPAVLLRLVYMRRYRLKSGAGDVPG